jgi:thiol-disulfide isomerase/thioredoxin
MTQPTDELVYQPFGQPTEQPDTAPIAQPAPGSKGPAAPAIQSDTWINVDKPIAWDALRGKVVMVEFWTFDCINCQHVTPYLKGMYADYKNKGFVLIGVHSPEFSYEHDLQNVRDAVAKNGIQYPVAIDNDFANWNRYGNLAWPAMYLVDKQGAVRYRHIGEGDYTEMRQWIERLLAE